MNRHTLAKALRRRLARSSDPGEVARRTDEQIVDAYLRCCHCRGELFADRHAAVNNAEDPAEFLRLLSLALAAHRCAAAN
jgi:hypothetical protein